MTDNLPAETEEIDWYARARSTLQVTDTKGTSKLTRRLLANLCSDLANSIPLETAARLHGITVRGVYKWCETREPVARLIEQARARGEKRCLDTIAADRSWKAQRELLALVNKDYGAVEQQGGRSGVNITINVPIPGAVEAGQQPMIDVTPAGETEGRAANTVDNQGVTIPASPQGHSEGHNPGEGEA